MNLLDAMLDVANFNLNQKLTQSVIQAKFSLGLPYESEIYQNTNVYDGKTYIDSIHIIGWRLAPMYDHAPISFASYAVNQIAVLHTKPQTLLSAKESITQQFIINSWYGEDSDYVIPDSSEVTSAMSGLELLDNFGNVVAFAKIGANDEIQWQETPVMNKYEIAFQDREVRRLLELASVEAGWDNFGTADQLRNDAKAIKRNISIATHAKNLVE